MKIIICEKPSVARDIAKVLKVGNKKQGYFEGNGYAITWAFGHLVRLCDPPEYGEHLKRWQLDTLPIVPKPFKLELQKNNGVEIQFNAMNMLLNKEETTEIICATDAGREGELIFRHIYTLTNCEKPIKRLWISSQTDKAIKEGFDNLKPGNEYDGLYDSALSRSEADWIVGINATRAYTTRFSNGTGVMSVGRVQTPVLKMIVDRFQIVQNFEPETYFEVEATIKHENGEFIGLYQKDKESRLQSKEIAEKIVEDCKDAKKGNILQINTKPIQEKPPLLYDLTELQKDANKKFKFSADQTLKLMQDLYEKHKILSYPRTSSRYLSNDQKPKINGYLNLLSDLPPYQSHVKNLQSKPLNLDSRTFDDKKVTDHHAIIPTDKKPNLSQLSEVEYKIYDLVIKRFLANFMENCIKENTEILSKITEHTFRSAGTVMKSPGWRSVYQEDTKEETEEKPKKKKGKKEDPLLPLVSENDTIELKKAKALKKQTKAPSLYTEASILAAMETAGKTIDDEEMRQAMKDCGLGTPATRAQILERLIKVQYIERKKNNLIPTEKGIKLISYIQDPQLLSPEMTGNWEKQLNGMVTGDVDRSNYMEQIIKFTHSMIQNVKECEVKAEDIHPDSLGPCPLCGGSVIENTKVFGCNEWRRNSCKFKIWKEIAKKKIGKTIAKRLLKEKKTDLLSGFKSKAGKDFETSLILNSQGDVKFDFSTPRPSNTQKVSATDTKKQT